MTLLVGALIAVWMLVVLPLGLRLVDGLSQSWARAWPVVAAPAVVALLLPRGWLAAALATPYAAMCTALALLGVRRFVAARDLRPTQVATATALVTPAVAAHSLVAERAGYELLGFDLSRIYFFVWGIYGVLAGVAGVLLASFLGVSSASAGQLTASAFSIVVLGGLGSVSGSLVAAYVVGYLETITAYLIAPTLRPIPALLLLVLVIYVRPQGILGRR